VNAEQQIELEVKFGGHPMPESFIPLQLAITPEIPSDSAMELTVDLPIVEAKPM
jgi:hypothetical protein